MGKKLSKLFGKKDMRILMLGLDAAGKNWTRYCTLYMLHLPKVYHIFGFCLVSSSVCTCIHVHYVFCAYVFWSALLPTLWHQQLLCHNLSLVHSWHIDCTTDVSHTYTTPLQCMYLYMFVTIFIFNPDSNLFHYRMLVLIANYSVYTLTSSSFSTHMCMDAMIV